MKIQIDLSKTLKPKVKDKHLGIRIPHQDYQILKNYNDNVSHTIRSLISQFVSQLHQTNNSKWTHKE